jgi:Flp pilus assembly protein TadG
MEAHMFAKIFALHRSKGQSLVETALFLPILLVLLAGLVEVSNLLVTQNRVSTASRVATGFGASNYSGDDWSDPDLWAESIANVAMNNVTNTLDLDEELWDIWVVKATLNDAGTSYVEWNAQHAYGQNSVVTGEQWTARETQIQDDVLDALDDSDTGLQVVATVAYHDRQSLLGLNAFNIGALTEVRGLNVMRVDERPPFASCPLIPIAVRFDQYSAYPSNWDGDQLHPDLYPNDPISLFPTHFNSPNPIPVYQNNVAAPNLQTDTYKRNVPGVPLRDAKPGYIFWAREEEGPGGFGYLAWDESNGPNELREMIWPGNFTEKYPGGPFDAAPHGDEDGVLEVGEWLGIPPGNMRTLQDQVDNYINYNKPAILIVYDQTNGKGGNNAMYRVAGFVKVWVIGTRFTKNPKWMAVEFIEWADECQDLSDS